LKKILGLFGKQSFETMDSALVFLQRTIPVKFKTTLIQRTLAARRYIETILNTGSPSRVQETVTTFYLNYNDSLLKTHCTEMKNANSFRRIKQNELFHRYTQGIKFINRKDLKQHSLDHVESNKKKEMQL
jgi:hypothetical protein